MRLIDADALKEKFLSKTHLTLFELLDLIDNAPTVDTGDTKYLEERDADAWESGYIQGLSEQRPQGSCENCDYKKFTETFIDNVVEVMNKNGITSIEQLSEMLKGGAK